MRFHFVLWPIYNKLLHQTPLSFKWGGSLPRISSGTQEVILLHLLQLKQKLYLKKKCLHELIDDCHHRNQETDCPVLTTPLSGWEVISWRWGAKSAKKKWKLSTKDGESLRFISNCCSSYYLYTAKYSNSNSSTWKSHILFMLITEATAVPISLP